ncbi:MAG: hypothetical protein ACU84Q_09260 [Gammaproteobacteria bacterium]
MTLHDLASIAEIVGALAVVVTLIYLTLELRRNTAATRQQSYHDIVTRRAAWFDTMTRHAEFTEIFIKGQNAEDLDEVESQQYVAGMITFLSHFQDVYLQHRSGIVEKGVWDAERKMLAAVTSAKGFKNWWTEASQYFIDEFVEEVERIETVYPVIYDRDNMRWARPDSELPWLATNLHGVKRTKNSPNQPIESDA